LSAAIAPAAAVAKTRCKAPIPSTPRAPFFRWREQWCVGIEPLDRDRRALAAILNHLALRFGERRDSTPPQSDRGDSTWSCVHARPLETSSLRYWLNALHARAREHFGREESLMRAAHYPTLPEHAGEHALMLAEYTAMVREIVARGDERLRLADLEALKQWFMGHVLHMDMRLGRYLKANGISPLRPQQGSATLSAAQPGRAATAVEQAADGQSSD
jgi:hemerythrin